MNVGIIGMGKYVPDQIVTNFDLEKKMDTSDEWIRTRTGIEERRIAPESINTSDMSYYSALEALKTANIKAEQIDLILVATVTPDQVFPTVSTMLQDRLGATKAAAMDISAACAGFIYGLITAQQFVQNGLYKHVLVVGAEKLSSIIDWEDRNTAVLFGDGAGAAVVGEVEEGLGFLASDLGADGSGGSHIEMKDHLMMNGREVFKFAVRKMGESSLKVVEAAGLKKEDVDFLIPHQANIRIMEASRLRLDLPIEKMSNTVYKYGNTSSASIPLSIIHELENNRINKGDVIVLVGFGAGLVWGSISLKWAY